MPFENDYIMRLIQDWARFLARALFNKDTPAYEVIDEKRLSPADLLYRRLIDLAEEGELNAAEDLLFENLDTSDKNQLAAALGYYYYINTFSDDFLDASGFPRAEIEQGITAVTEKFGYKFSAPKR